jgi:hypothetical protein
MPPFAPLDLVQAAGYALAAGWRSRSPTAPETATRRQAWPGWAPDLIAAAGLLKDLAFVRPQGPMAHGRCCLGNVIHFTVKSWAERAGADWLCFGDLSPRSGPSSKANNRRADPPAAVTPTWRPLADPGRPGRAAAACLALLPLPRYTPGSHRQLGAHLATAAARWPAACARTVLQGRYRQHELARVLAELRARAGRPRVQFRDASITERAALPLAITEALIAQPLT